MLCELSEAFGNRPAVIARELTKKFEEFKRGTLGSLKCLYENDEPRGEFVVLVAGANGDMAPSVEPIIAADPASCYDEHILRGCSPKEALRAVAKQLNIGRREVYNAVLAKKKIRGQVE